MISRRQRFRDYMVRVNGAADPADSISQGFYIAPKDSVARRIAARLDLRPASSHLVVGGVGSGKTTQLLITRDILLAEHPDAVAIYVDLSLHQDLDELQPGSLLALAGLTLCDAAAPSVTVQGLQKSSSAGQPVSSTLRPSRWTTMTLRRVWSRLLARHSPRRSKSIGTN